METDEALLLDSPSLSMQTSPSSRNLALYSSYMLAAWAWRGMEFTVALILLELLPDSLLLVSIFGLLDNGVRVVFGGMIGNFLDNSPRLSGAIRCYLFQNTCIVASGFGLSAAIAGLIDRSSHLYWIVVSISLVLAALASVGSSGIQISVERSMPKIIYQDSEVELSNMNARFRALDLLALLLSPIASGALMTLLKPWAAILALSLYALIAWIPEIILLSYAVNSSPALSAPKEVAKPRGAKQKWLAGGSWKTYIRQPVFLACLSLALLYCTVLSLGFLMTSFLKWSGMTEVEVSLYRGLGALTGLVATLVYPSLQRLLGSSGVGVLGIFYQLIMLGIGVSPVVISYFGLQARPSLLLVRLLITLVAASRTGLWLFDLAVTQIMQDGIAPAELGTVNGVQVAVCALFETASFICGLVLPDPLDFPALMLGSISIVASSALLYSVWFMQRRRSLSEERNREAERGNEEAEGLLNGQEDKESTLD